MQPDDGWNPHELALVVLGEVHHEPPTLDLATLRKQAKHDLFERASKVGRGLVTQWDWRAALQKALLSIKSKDKFWLQQLLSERRGRHWRMISDRIPWLADEGSQQSSDNLCVGHDSFKEQFNISGASPGVLVKDSMLLHPCQASGCKWVLLNTDQRAVAVRPAGTWRSKTSFMIGFIDASQSLSQLEGKHPADVGYFFSPSGGLGRWKGTHGARREGAA
ncbi:unnamed protein product [Effrenium voratum]|uniref:Uncharacterized protein n=1 Tax=Effrenium voratum TaxID=2562239 RepID=A0AA36JD29_9DINO|nr:unnamed protein product [Effrenium voratum]